MLVAGVAASTADAPVSTADVSASIGDVDRDDEADPAASWAADGGGGDKPIDRRLRRTSGVAVSPAPPGRRKGAIGIARLICVAMVARPGSQVAPRGTGVGALARPACRGGVVIAQRVVYAAATRFRQPRPLHAKDTARKWG